MPRNIVICCDAGANVSNAYFGISNVLKLYITLNKDDSQRCYYHPGSPSKKSHKAWGETIAGIIKSIVKFDLFELSVALFGFVRESEYVANLERLAFGSAWLEQVACAYEFLVAEYQEGDRIFLFGFSFGAYAVRVLANLVQTYGILDPRVKNVIPDVTDAFKQLTRWVRDGEELWKSGLLLKRTFSRDALVEFVGVWDTAGSIGLVHTNPIALPHANEVPITRRARQELSMDERRWGFRARPFEERVDRTKGHPVRNKTSKKYGLRAFIPMSAAAIWK